MALRRSFECRSGCWPDQTKKCSAPWPRLTTHEQPAVLSPSAFCETSARRGSQQLKSLMKPPAAQVRARRELRSWRTRHATGDAPTAARHAAVEKARERMFQVCFCWFAAVKTHSAASRASARLHHSAAQSAEEARLDRWTRMIDGFRTEADHVNTSNLAHT